MKFKGFKRYIRGVRFLFTSLFIEKPAGLDFSMRQKEKGIITDGNNGYALTEQKAFDQIMKYVKADSNDNFIDIGCGKGGVLRYAAKYGFGRVAGLEIEDSLYEIAVKNFKKLKLQNIELYHDNALTFSKYDEFNVFFFFNPFETAVYQAVLDKIFESLKSRQGGQAVILICYGKSVPEHIQKSGLFSLVASYEDDVRGTGVCIWRQKNMTNHNREKSC